MAQWRELIGAPAREVCLGGEIIFGSGASVSLDGGRAVELTIQEGADGAIDPGDVLSASIVLDLNNDAGQWRTGGSLLGAQELIGATLMPRLGVRNGDSVLWRPLGVFQVESAMELEQQARLRLRGADNIAMVLGDAFEDDAQAYPTTLAQLWRRAAAQGGSSFVGEVPNGTATIDAAPDWQGASLRGAMGCIAAAAGCFVRLSRMGALELCRVWDPQAQPRAIGAQQYLTLQLGAEHYGPVDALRLRPVGGETDTEIVYRTGESALHTLAISDNPLFQADAAHLNALAQGTLSQLAGYAGGAAQFEWRGDPELQVGARIALTDAHGRAFSGIISRQTMRYSGGFRAECACVLPESADSGVRRAITPEGRLNAAALTGALNGAMLSAGSVTTNKLAAGSVTADKIAAGAVDAISINAVKARLAEITAEDIETDELAAELARITVLIAGTAAFDAATIKHLVAEAMNLEYGVAGQVFIKNLAVEYAQMVGAAIGKLCIRASDGKYYLLDVGADGRVTATETTVTDGEIEAGQTSGGSVIVETNITAANLTTTNLLATYALINKIDAARIDVDELVARRTFTDALYTGRIYGGKSLEIIVGDVSRAQSAADTAKTAADKAQSSVDNLAVGGRNYIRNGNFSAGENHWEKWGSPTTREVVEMSGKHWLHIAGNADLEFQGVSQVLPFMRHEPLVVSFTAYASAENTALTMIIHQIGLNNDPQIYNNYTLGTAPKRYFKTFTSADDATKATFKLMLGPRKSANDVYITDIKFERGNRATDWTPAPEDTNSRIDDARTAADKAQSDIDGMAIGGRNLVLKSDAEKGPARNNQYDIAANRFIAGEYYACSVEMKSPNEKSVDVYMNDDSGAGRINIPFSRWLGVKLTPDWVRYSFVYKADKDYDYPGKGHIVLRVYGTAADAADISVRRVKVERGNKATDWTAAPEDTDGKIDNAQTAADNAQSAADNAQTTANGAKTAADNAQTAADNAQTAANGAQASADNAQNTASAARTATEQLQVSVEGVLEQTVDGVRIGRRINGQTAPNSLFAGPDGIDVCVENRAVSSFRSDYIKLLGMQIRVPEGIGGLIISSYAPETPQSGGSGSAP